MPGSGKKIADAAMNVLGKPLQTALSALSLLGVCGEHIDAMYFQFEPVGSGFDAGLPYAVAEYLQEGFERGEHGHKIVTRQPLNWLGRNVPEPDKLNDPGLRLSIRYQQAWESTDKPYLLTVHNDIFVFKNLLKPMLDLAGADPAPFAVGGVGQCWNCPAASQAVVDLGMPGRTACSPARYADFQPTFAQLSGLYEEAARQGRFTRPYNAPWCGSFVRQPWPLPECRVNEWVCLVNMDLARPRTVPLGHVTPFGAFGLCGGHLLDTAAPWFRGMNALGLRAAHFPVERYMKHWVGTGKKTQKKHNQAEDNARRILEKHFPDFARWSKAKRNGLFEV